MENQAFDSIAVDTTIRTPKGYLLDNTERARWTIILLWIVMGFAALVLLSAIMQFQLIEKAKTIGVSQEEADSNDRRGLMIGLAYTASYIVSTIVFIRWFRRAYANLERIGVLTRFNEGWAAGSWFVPVLNFGRPVRIMIEIAEEISIALGRANAGTAAGPNTVLIG